MKIPFFPRLWTALDDWWWDRWVGVTIGLEPRSFQYCWKKAGR